MRSVEVHDNQGKVICKIEAPFTWKEFLLSFTPIALKWKDPLVIEEWALAVAQLIASWEAEGHEPVMEHGGRELVYDNGAVCPVCEYDTVFPRIGRRKRELRGYSCFNKDCPMRNVIIPPVLVDRVKQNHAIPRVLIDKATQRIIIPKDLVYGMDEKSVGLAFAPLLIAFEKKPEALISAAVAWKMKEYHRLSEPEAPRVYRDDDGHILEWTDPIDREKIIQQKSERDANHITECVEAGLCTRCEKPISGILKKADTEMSVSRAENMYLLIYTHTGLCMSCIDEFLESVLSEWKKQEHLGQD